MLVAPGQRGANGVSRGDAVPEDFQTFTSSFLKPEASRTQRRPRAAPEAAGCLGWSLVIERGSPGADTAEVRGREPKRC